MHNNDVEITIRGFVSEKENIRKSNDHIAKYLRQEVAEGNLDMPDMVHFEKIIRKLYERKMHIAVVGAIGCGKSSTINAILSCGSDNGDPPDEFAAVGSGIAQQTRYAERFQTGNLVLWDTPSPDCPNDRKHAAIIKDLLRKTKPDGTPLIDLVLAVIDGSTRDMGSFFRVINGIVLPALSMNTDRILPVMNQADLVLRGGRHWDVTDNHPDPMLKRHLDECVKILGPRVMENTGIEVTPVYYSAGYRENAYEHMHSYHLAELIFTILEAITL